MIKSALLLLIRAYQRTLSPDHGVFSGLTPYGCRFYPTCSEYTYQAIEKYGVTKGAVKGAWRVLRCNPFSKGGVDLP